MGIAKSIGVVANAVDGLEALIDAGVVPGAFDGPDFCS